MAEIVLSKVMCANILKSLSNFLMKHAENCLSLSVL